MDSLYIDEEYHHRRLATAGKTQPVFYNFRGLPLSPDGKKYVALTFDDGPHQHLTPRLLDILKEHKAKATFYVMGVKALIHPDILYRAVNEGNEVANHVFDHPVLTKIHRKDLVSQLKRTSDAIVSATKLLPKTMRPPYGLTNRRNNDVIFSDFEMTIIMWSLDTMDWQHPKEDVIIDRVLKKVKHGDVILCHDIHAGTINAMKGVIEGLQKAGYELITASEMVQKWAEKDQAAASTAV